MHASTPLPSPPLGCATLFYPPFPYSHSPSSPLYYHRIPPRNSAPHRSTHLPSPTQPSHTLPSQPHRCPIIPLASSTIPYPLPYPPLPYPPYSSLNSPPLHDPTLSSHLLRFPIYPLLASAPFLTPLPYSPLPSPFLPSPTIHSPPLIPSPLPYLTLPSPQLPSPTHCITLHHSLTPFPTLSSHLLYSPTIPSTPFIPQLTYPTLQSPLPHPFHLFPSLPSPRLPYLPYVTLPPLPYYTLPSTTIPSHPRHYLPTYLPSHPYHTLAFPTLSSPHTRPIASPPLSSPTLPSPLPYNIPPVSLAPTLLYSLLYYSSLASHPYLPTLASYPCIPYPPLPSHPLPCPLPYRIPPDRSRGRNVSFRTSLGYLNPSLFYTLLPYLPNTPYPMLPIYFLPFHSSTLTSHPLRSSPLS